MSSWQAAWHQDCATVGLAAPSTELGEIKRAYAKTLRKTRPDDDAQAYQALREAYDRLVAHARWHQEHGAQAAEAEAEPAIDAVVAPIVEPVLTPASHTEAPAPIPVGRIPLEALEAALALDAELASAEPPAPAPSSAHFSPVPLHRFQDDEDAPPQETRDERRSSTPAPAPAADWIPEPLPEWRSPEALCDWLMALRKRGLPALNSALPELREALDALPLHVREHASLCFANFILETRAELPARLIHLLRDHFAWEDDFRVERRLGPERMAALVELLQGFPRPVTDPALLEQFGPVAAIARLAGSWESSDRNTATLAATLMGYALHLQLLRAGGILLRRLGADVSDQQAVMTLLRRVQGWHFLMIVLGIFGLKLAVGEAVDDAFGHTLAQACILILCFAAFDKVLEVIRGARTIVGRQWPARWRVPGGPLFWAWAGVALMVVGGALFQLTGHHDPSDAWLVPLSILAGVIGLSMAMPDDLGSAMTQTALLAYAFAALGTVSPLGVGLLGGWVFAGPLVLRCRIYTPNPTWRLQPAWPAGGWRAVAGLMTFGLPVLASWLSSIAGLRMILGALALAAVVPMAKAASQPMPMRAVMAVVALWIGIGVVLGAQRLGWRLGLRLAARRSETIPAH